MEQASMGHPKVKRENRLATVSDLWFVSIRILYGLGWLAAGITKITEGWFHEPGVFLHEYLVYASQNPNVAAFYRAFLEIIALPNVWWLNYTIPLAQMMAGVMLIAGIRSYLWITVCLFMHVNFILSGNMNVISLTLYTATFLIILGGRRSQIYSLDHWRVSRSRR